MTIVEMLTLIAYAIGSLIIAVCIVAGVLATAALIALSIRRNPIDRQLNEYDRERRRREFLRE